MDELVGGASVGVIADFIHPASHEGQLRLFFRREKLGRGKFHRLTVDAFFKILLLYIEARIKYSRARHKA